MDSVNGHEAKTHLSRHLERVERGERVIIARAGKRIAVPSPHEPPGRVGRVPGRWRDRVWIADDFEAPLPEFEESRSGT